MNIHVYDTYAQAKNGGVLHFDVFMPEQNETNALIVARNWLASIGEDGNRLTQERCRFCHTETANPAVASAIEEYGYFIFQMEGCPQPARQERA